MTHSEELSDPTMLSPDEAFDVLGNETRVQILRTLGAADSPLSFTELRDRVGIRQGGRFNYHLDKVVGHFARKTDEGYTLRQAGRRVVQAVLSEAITDAPVVDRTRIEHPCQYCGAPIEIRYHEGHVEMFCTECAGTRGRDAPDQHGYLGCLPLPPAGLQTRSTVEAFRAAWIWTRLSIFAVANGLCPQCSATLDRWVNVCEEHDATGGLCAACDRRHAIQFRFDCTNCIYEGEGSFEIAIVATTDVLAFLTVRGLNPVSPTEIAAVSRTLDDFEAVVRSTDPFKGQVTFTADGDALTLTVDENLDVIDVPEHRPSETV